jgi:hypothetical protein
VAIREDVKIISTSSGASVCAAVLLCLRLLRALLASVAFTIALVLLLFGFCLVGMMGAGIGWFMFDLPWWSQFRSFAIGIAIVIAGLAVLIGMAIAVLMLYRWVQDGSVLAGWILLSLSLLSIALGVLDLYLGAVRVLVVPMTSAEARSWKRPRICCSFMWL